MGGIAVDAFGRSNIDGLFAAGEAACTGLHGANRLASNSLLEAAICGAEAGRFMAALSEKPKKNLKEIPLPPLPNAAPIQAIMTANLGILRDAAGLRRAIAEFAAHPKNPAADLGRRIAQAALARQNSIGAHSRSDDPAITLHHAA
jgi:L-aspartate oxidase